MANEHVKVYEDGKRGGVPLWAWLLPLLLLLALLGWFLMHRHAADATPAVAMAPAGGTSAAGTMPDLGSVHFATDQATLTPEGTATLTQAAGFMKAHPESHLRVEGYTDATGTDPHNDTLSTQRAATVVGFLTGQGIEKSRLTGEGFGQTDPVATNATTSGKADNRRVELFQQK